MSKPVTLIILDGWGIADSHSNNAISCAHTPVWQQLTTIYPHTQLSASGLDVGLPHGQMGNSEVGHLTIGAGRVIYQDLTRLNQSIVDGEFFRNTTLLNACHQAKMTQKALHIFGLLSPGGIHSHEDHILAALALAVKENVPQVFVHAFLDGRDTPPQSATHSLQKLEKFLAQHPNCELASVSGRYYAMDRDKRWERVSAAYHAISLGQAQYTAPSGLSALEQAYARQETDEFVKPTVIISPHHTQGHRINDGDIILYMNFRSDRARALTQAFTDPSFDGFSRQTLPQLGQFVTLTEYDKQFPVKVAFSSQSLENGLGEWFAKQHLSQLRIAETEKYAHVTFFFNGGQETLFNLEQRELIPSPKVATYDLQPEMSARAITRTLIQYINNQSVDVIVCNFANADMVGHTGNLNAAIHAVETLDQCLGEIIKASQAVGGSILITADHGNVECMFDNHSQQPHTAHTLSLVPLIYVGPENITFEAQGSLADIAPTLLTIMKQPIPPEMTGRCLIKAVQA